MKPIRLSEHTKTQIAFRGTTEGEVKETIKTSKWSSAELGRSECRKDFGFGKKRNKKILQN